MNVNSVDSSSLLPTGQRSEFSQKGAGSKCNKYRWVVLGGVVVGFICVLLSILYGNSADESATSSTSSQVEPSHIYASYAVLQYSASADEPIQMGPNHRRFSQINFLSGSRIQWNDTDGQVSVNAGTYLVSMSSIARWRSDDTAYMYQPPMSVVGNTTGHSSLVLNSNMSTSLHGTTEFAAWGTPSMWAGVLELEAPASMCVSHVMDARVADIWSGLNDLESNIFSSLSLMRLEDMFPSGAAYAVYSYSSDKPVPMVGWWNRARFNQVHAHMGDFSLNRTSGGVNIRAGTYWISGFSTVSFKNFSNSAQEWDPKFPVRGYAAVYAGKLDIAAGFITGTWASAVHNVASSFDTVFVTDHDTTLYVDSQTATLTDNLWLNLGSGAVSAQLSLIQLDESAVYGFFEYLARENLAVVEGWNIRQFTSSKIQGELLYDEDSYGVILQEGVYVLRGYSLATWQDNSDKFAVPPSPYPVGQARLKVTQGDGSSYIATYGTTAVTPFQTPSYFDTVLHVTEETVVMLEHLVTNTENAWLGLNTGASSNHVYASLSVVKMADGS